MSARQVLLGVSGQLTAGKDFIGGLVMERLAPGAVHLAFATPLKEEVSACIEVVASSTEAAREISRSQGVSLCDAEGLAEILAPVASPKLSGWSRTPEVRRALQYWATGVRRRDEPEYWVERAMEAAEREVEAGRSVYFTDLRFPNEAEGAKRAGFSLVRLEVSRATQERRLLARDGMEADLSALTHYSERALSGYSGFDLVVENDGEDPGVVVERVCSLWE